MGAVRRRAGGGYSVGVVDFRCATPVTSWSGKTRVPQPPPGGGGGRSPPTSTSTPPHTRRSLQASTTRWGTPSGSGRSGPLVCIGYRGGTGLEGYLEPRGCIEFFVLANTPRLKVLDRGIRVTRKRFSERF